MKRCYFNFVSGESVWDKDDKKDKKPKKDKRDTHAPRLPQYPKYSRPTSIFLNSGGDYVRQVGK